MEKERSVALAYFHLATAYQFPGLGQLDGTLAAKGCDPNGEFKSSKYNLILSVDPTTHSVRVKYRDTRLNVDREGLIPFSNFRLLILVPDEAVEPKAVKTASK